MGADLAPRWPEVLRRQDAENDRLRSQFVPESFWSRRPSRTLRRPSGAHHRPGRARLSRHRPAPRLRRASPTPPSATASANRRARRPPSLDRPRRDCSGDSTPRRSSAPNSPALASRPNASGGSLSTGSRASCPVPPRRSARPLIAAERLSLDRQHASRSGRSAAIGRRSSGSWPIWASRSSPLPTVSTVHCEIARPVEADYRELHLLATTPPAGLRFYSGAWERSYELDSETAADAIVAHAITRVRLPRGDRTRLCRRRPRPSSKSVPARPAPGLIGAILGDRPHLVRPGLPVRCIRGRGPPRPPRPV